MTANIETSPDETQKAIEKILVEQEEETSLKSTNEDQCEFLSEKLAQLDVDFVFDTISKEAPYDRISIKQLGYGMFSAFTKIPLPHNVNSKDSGAGKSYLLNLVGDYFPQEHVIILTGMSDKALLHRDGTMVTKNEKTGELTPTDPIIDQLNDEKETVQEEIDSEKSKVISDSRNTKDLLKAKTKRIKEIELEMKSLQRRQKKLITLDNMIIIIQDTPQDSLFEVLMSLISQDSQKEQEYVFTEKSSSGKLGTRSNMLKGMPVMFTTRVIDDTRNSRFEEKNRRFINVTPNISSEKIGAANTLMGKRYGCLPEEYDQLVVSRKDKEKVKRIVKTIVEKLKNHSSCLKPKESGVRILFEQAIASAIPHNDVWGMTVMDRTMRYLSIITKVNMDSRPRLVNIRNGTFYPISTFKDLEATLSLMERGGSNIRPYIAEWFNTVFLPAFKSLNGELRKVTTPYGEALRMENHVGLSTEELAQKTKELYGQTPGARQIREKYLYPLINQGIVNYARSEINGKENIYFPVEGEEDQGNIFSLFDSAQDFRLKINDPIVYPSKNVLEKEFRTLVRREGKDQVENKTKFCSDYKILDVDESELSVDQLLDRYIDNAESCFIRGFSDDELYHCDNNITTINNLNYSQQLVLTLKQYNDINNNKVAPTSPLEKTKSNNNIIEETAVSHDTLSVPEGGLEKCLGIKLVGSQTEPEPTKISESNTPESKIYRITQGSDKWACPDCNYVDDIWFMRKHPCEKNKRNSRK